MLIAAGSNVPRYYGSSHVTNYYYVVHISFFKSSGQVYFFSFLKILEKMQQEARTIYFFCYKMSLHSFINWQDFSIFCKIHRDVMMSHTYILWEKIVFQLYIDFLL